MLGSPPIRWAVGCERCHSRGGNSTGIVAGNLGRRASSDRRLSSSPNRRGARMETAKSYHTTGGDKIMTPRFAIGIGASSKAVAQDVLALIHECIDAVDPDTVLATLDRRSEIASTVAADLGVSFVVFPSDVLAQVRGLKTK